MDKRTPIGYLKATVEFPLYDGDNIERATWNDFIYEEPGISAKGDLAVCRRDCKTLSSEVRKV